MSIHSRHFKSWIEISKSALIANSNAFRSLIGNSVALLAVVKANAYGHGVAAVSSILKEGGVQWLGVDSREEALNVRAEGIALPLLIMGYTMRANLEEVVARGFRQVVYDIETLRMIDQEARRLHKKAYVHLKIETGTNRQGVLPAMLEPFIDFFTHHGDVVLEGIYTHFADIESENGIIFAKDQLARYQEALKFFDGHGIDIPLRHTAASAAIMRLPQSHFNLVRLGIGLYGLWPSETTKQNFLKSSRSFTLAPVMQWKSVVAQVKTVKKGEAIGYGLSQRLKRDSTIAIIPQGYADGYDRKLSSKGEVLIHGMRAKVIGRICMNMCMVDVTDIDGVKVEDEAVLLGTEGQETISAEELADKISTINYEVIARINPLIPRIVVN